MTAQKQYRLLELVLHHRLSKSLNKTRGKHTAKCEHQRNLGSTQTSLVWSMCELFRGKESSNAWSTQEWLSRLKSNSEGTLCLQDFRLLKVSLSFRGFAKGWFPKGWFPKGWFGGCSLDPQTGTNMQKRNDGTKNRNGGTKTGTTVPKTATRVHSPKPPFYKTALLFPLDLRPHRCLSESLLNRAVDG